MRRTHRQQCAETVSRRLLIGWSAPVLLVPSMPVPMQLRGTTRKSLGFETARAARGPWRRAQTRHKGPPKAPGCCFGVSVLVAVSCARWRAVQVPLFSASCHPVFVMRPADTAHTCTDFQVTLPVSSTCS